MYLLFWSLLLFEFFFSSLRWQTWSEFGRRKFKLTSGYSQQCWKGTILLITAVPRTDIQAILWSDTLVFCQITAWNKWHRVKFLTLYLLNSCHVYEHAYATAHTVYVTFCTLTLWKSQLSVLTDSIWYLLTRFSYCSTYLDTQRLEN